MKTETDIGFIVRCSEGTHSGREGVAPPTFPQQYPNPSFPIEPSSDQCMLHLLVTFVGQEPEGIQIDREVAGFVKRHLGNISANDFCRHGNIINTQFVVEGDGETLDRIRKLIPMFASEFGVVGLAHFCTEVASSIEVRSQGNYRFSLHGRDYPGLLFDCLSAIHSAGYQVMLCHGRLQSLWADEIPIEMREHPEAHVEYRLTVTLQPTSTASLSTLHSNFGRLYDENGVLWTAVV